MKPVVSIVCITYNHEPYIKNALDSFVMQKTNFPFEILISDDYSTDGTRKIIDIYKSKYPDIIRDISPNRNTGIAFNWCYSQREALGDYIALCEGDDFWVDQYKLQKQIEILRNNPDCVGVYTNRCKVDTNGNVVEERTFEIAPKNGSLKYDIRSFFKYYPLIPTASVVYKTDNKVEIMKKLEYTANQFLGDWPLWIILLSYGNMFYLDEVTTAYRINPTSITHVANRIGRARASFEICRKVADILPEQYSDIAEALRNTDCHIMPLAHAYRKEHKYFHAIWYTIVSLIKSPSLTFGWFRNYFVRTNK